MHQVRIVTHYGQPIIVDQCEKCGGIWFDESELFLAKQGEAEKIEVLNTAILRTPTMTDSSKLMCPKDQTAMHRFTDKYFPQDIVLVRCPSCHGIWLNRGIFTKYQQFRQERMRPKEKNLPDKTLEENINQLIASHQSGRSGGTLERLGKFLSTPMKGDTSVSPDYSQGFPLAENTVSVALNILVTIFRAFILKF